ncbi:hypothetical protein FRC14_007916 [Serendipita sp. 396]|nr:hypothetical protein FRC14_007916 [Serendipita sp. 396]KAG8781907.1 hypothetical protein FRC15_007879 [Serendipita sp. 397]
MSLPSRIRSVGPPKFQMNDISDPLTRHLMNSRGAETEQDRIIREKAEREALKRSKEIDEWIQKEKNTKDKERKKRKTSKILLVGQSESGKSTTLKNFQLHYAPKAFEAERMRWKTVILLNIVRSIRKINDALTTYSASRADSNAQTYPSPRATPLGSPINQKSGFDFFAPAGSDEDDEGSDLGVSTHLRRPKLTPRQNVLLMRLRPIISLEPQLLQSLLSTESNGPAPPVFLPGFGSNLHKFPRNQDPTPYPAGTSWRNEVPDDYTAPIADYSTLPTPISPIIVSDEVALPANWNISRSNTMNTLSSNNLMETFSSSPSTAVPTRRQQTETEMITPKSSMSTSAGSTSFSPLSNPLTNSGFEKPFAETSQRGGGLGGSNPSIRGNMRSPTPTVDPFEVPERVLAACASDILSLWRDDVLRNMLCGPLSMGGLGLKLHEDAGFFLDDVERVTAPNYVPTDDDVLRARLRTMGVSEHRFVIEEDVEPISELIVYDVGGARTQRHQWISFFDDVNVIIFLAPISPFDQRLAEDPSVNRLQDTFNLWKDICRSPALAHADFLVFLNKCDLLNAKLRRGLKLQKFIPQYRGDNSLPDVVKFFRGVFYQIWAKSNQQLKLQLNSNRTLHMHSTSMIDIKASQTVIRNVQECALRSNLRMAMVI